MSDLIPGDVLDVARRFDVSGRVEWLGPFAVVEAEGHSVRVLDHTSELEVIERSVSYARIRRRVYGPALPEWLVREREQS